MVDRGENKVISSLSALVTEGITQKVNFKLVFEE
jgi:hypothetical protein